jgi:hypothetical protein
MLICFIVNARSVFKFYITMTAEKVYSLTRVRFIILCNSNITIFNFEYVVLFRIKFYTDLQKRCSNVQFWVLTIAKL